VVVSCIPDNVQRLQGLAEEGRVSFTLLGTVGGEDLTVSGPDGKPLISVAASEAKRSWEESLPRLFERPQERDFHQ
jgi:hypothetical protein